MPKEEKEKKKFKAVTEELTDTHTDSPATSEAEKEKEEIVEVTHEEHHHEETPSFAVRETDNIDLSKKHQERGVFLKFFVLTFFATLLAFLLAGGIYVYLTGVNKNSGSNQKTSDNSEPPVASSTPTPSSTPVANVDLTTFKISVLNGNGGIGVASGAKAVIEKAGFKVTSVGNADNFNFTDTMVQTKPSVSDSVVSKLKDALSAKYSVKIGDPLDADSNFDFVVIVGSN